jgi:hypothetical protein
MRVEEVQVADDHADFLEDEGLEHGNHPSVAGRAKGTRLALPPLSPGQRRGV